MAFYRAFDPSIEQYIYFKIETKINKENNPYMSPTFTFHISNGNEPWVECPVKHKSNYSDRSRNFFSRREYTITVPGDGHMQLEYIRESELNKKPECSLSFNPFYGCRTFHKLKNIEITQDDVPETLQRAEMRQMDVTL